MFSFLIHCSMKEKKVLLFSGGFDSILQEYLLKPDVLLYVDMKTSYSQREIEALDKLPQHYKKRLVIKELPLGEYERESKYLPYRNLILGAIGMQYGQHVYFGFNKSDCAPDKDKVFLVRTNHLFEHLNVDCVADMGWPNENFSFEAPWKDYTKTDMVRMCLAHGMSKRLIQSVRSCYDSYSENGCGHCPVCYKKAVALINNGIYEDRFFDTPITSENLQNWLDDVKDYYPACLTKDTRSAIALLRKQGQ